MQASTIFIVVAVAVLLYLIGCYFDRDRIRGYIRNRGGEALTIHWVLFGTGWFGDKNRIYSVTYVDGDKNTHHATVKTSMLAGVYFTDDEVIEYAIDNTFNAVSLEPDVRESIGKHSGEHVHRFSDFVDDEVGKKNQKQSELEALKADYESKLNDARQTINELKDKNKKLQNVLCKAG